MKIVCQKLALFLTMKRNPYIRQTQREEYWRDKFTVTDQEVEQLYGLLLEEGTPLFISDLAIRLMERRCQEEEAALKKESERRGEVFQPRESYEVGQRLFFPALDGATGKVVGVRQGDNPEYGEFEVIQVQLDGEGDIKEFAAAFQPPHKLNLPEPLSPRQLYQRFGRFVQHKLWQKLEAHPEFVHFDDQWFLKDLMVEIHIGHLNIAEAMIDLAGTPLSSEALLEEIELSQDIPQSARAFSLNYALARDERFLNVGDDNSPLWSLAYLEKRRKVSVAPLDEETVEA